MVVGRLNGGWGGVSGERGFQVQKQRLEYLGCANVEMRLGRQPLNFPLGILGPDLVPFI